MKDLLEISCGLDAEEFSSLQFDEEELYSKYKAFYGYTFFIAKKIEQ